MQSGGAPHKNNEIYMHNGKSWVDIASVEFLPAYMNALDRIIQLWWEFMVK